MYINEYSKNRSPTFTTFLKYGFEALIISPPLQQNQIYLTDHNHKRSTNQHVTSLHQPFLGNLNGNSRRYLFCIILSNTAPTFDVKTPWLCI